jgi:hypothetical protein
VASQISAPVRIVALIGLLSALAMGAWMTLGSAGGTSAGPADNALAAPLAAEAQAKAAAAKLSAHNVNTAAGKPDTTVPAKAKVKTAAKPKVTAAAKPAAKVKAAPKATPARKPPAMKLLEGTPRTIGSLLATHGVVVVLLYNPKAKVDSYSLGEAVLGAQQASAGFLRVNVLDQAQALPFAAAYGVLQDPTLLFFVRPGKLVQKLVGFADHETIAQAATNEAVLAGWVPTAAQRKLSAAATVAAESNLASWRTNANDVCKSNQVFGRQALPATATDAQGAAYVRGFEKQMDRVIVGLTALPLPSAASDRALAGSFINLVKKERRDLESFLQARLNHDAVASNARWSVLLQDETKGSALAKRLGLSECG